MISNSKSVRDGYGHGRKSVLMKFRWLMKCRGIRKKAWREIEIDDLKSKLPFREVKVHCFGIGSLGTDHEAE